MLKARAPELGRDTDMRRNVPTGTLLAPQPKARGKILGRRRTACQKKQCTFYIYIYLTCGTEASATGGATCAGVRCCCP